ncbi:hypothetical protein DL96DRAFT_1810666 [Flagelloscypha sp. PMI_526]|nr:hypothetical protein DL96DRAFT_1810666 [Flagelloscypha sp. PMI_526]
MRSSLAALATLATLIAAGPLQPRTVTEWTYATTVTTSEYLYQICYVTETATTTIAGVTKTTPNPGTSTITESWVNYGGTSTYKRPVKREQTITKTMPTMLIINEIFTTDCVKGPFETRNYVTTTPNPTSTTAVPSYEHTTTTTTWWPFPPTSTA